MGIPYPLPSLPNGEWRRRQGFSAESHRWDIYKYVEDWEDQRCDERVNEWKSRTYPLWERVLHQMHAALPWSSDLIQILWIDWEINKQRVDWNRERKMDQFESKEWERSGRRFCEGSRKEKPNAFVGVLPKVKKQTAVKTRFANVPPFQEGNYTGKRQNSWLRFPPRWCKVLIQVFFFKKGNVNNCP